MKNSIGNNLVISLFGESHGDSIGIVVDGLPAGVAIDTDFMQQQMKKRKGSSDISTKRHEDDEVEFASGYFEGRTTGAPLCLYIKNKDVISQDYEQNKYRMRPSHADFVANEKFHGFQDYRGGGHFSGRLSAPIVAAGAIALQILKSLGIVIGTHILQCYDEYDAPFAKEEALLKKQIQALEKSAFPCIQKASEKKMIEVIRAQAAAKDSVGGVLESCVLHMPYGIGEPFFDSCESIIAHYLYSIPACKSVSFGAGYDFANLLGSEANDPFFFDGKVKTKSNHNGGINGGISNGMPILLQSVFKPTPSIYQKQDSIHMQTHKKESITIKGRHDPAIIHRACVVVDSMLALAILDLYMSKQAREILKGENL